MIVTLPGDIDTGLQWSILSIEGSGVKPGGAIEVSAFSPEKGKAGVFEIPLLVMEAARSKVDLEYRRPWQKDEPAEKTFSVTLDIRDTPIAELMFKSFEKGIDLGPKAACNHEYENFSDHEVLRSGRWETCIYATCKHCGKVQHQYSH